jgi:GxxExxY protein
VERSQSGATNIEGLASAIVDAGLKVHRALGPGLLESTYEHCLAHELQIRGLEARRQKFLPVIYDGVKIDAG